MAIEVEKNKGCYYKDVEKTQFEGSEEASNISGGDDVGGFHICCYFFSYVNIIFEACDGD